MRARNRSLGHMVAVILALTLATAGPSWATTILVADDFNDNGLDGAKWTVVTAGIPQDPKGVNEINQQIELEGRAHLNTVAQLNPATAPEDGLRITGQWTFVSGDDMLQILTRSDGTPGGGYGETNNGVEFRVLGWNDGSAMTIGGRGGAGVSGVANAGNLNVAAGETYNFEVLDDGLNLTFSMQQVGGTKQRTVTAASSSAMGSNLVTFHNRESGRRSNLDNVVIESPDPTPLVVPGALLVDDFNDNSIDPVKWNVVTAGIPQNPKSATETNYQMQLEGRAHLNTVQEFDPTALSGDGIRIRGEWTFVSNDDMLQILTRSDGTPGGSYGETNNGVEFRVQAAGVGDTMTIGSRGGASVSDVFNNGSLGAAAGETYDFEILDNGQTLAFSMQQVGGTKQRTIYASSSSAMATNLISFHDREGGRRSDLDNVVIDSPAPYVLDTAGALLADDFNDNSLDPTKWTTNTSIPQGNVIVREANQHVELQGRGHLNTAQEFDPAAVGGDGLRIRGQWTFLTGVDFMQVLTRSDGTPGGGWGETSNGVEFYVSNTGDMTIRNRGGATVTNVVNNGPLGRQPGETYDFEIRDDGQHLLFTMSQVGGTKQRAVMAQSPSAMGTNLVTFHNREGGGNRAALDNVVVGTAPSHVPIHDDFNDNALDATKWFAVTGGIPQNPKSLTETNGHIELEGRAHLNTVNQYDPLTAPDDGVRIRGEWTFVSNDDMLQILTRTDGTPGGSYGETNSGIEFRVQAAGVGDTMTIGSRGGAAVTGVVNSGGLNAQAGETYAFEILDNGNNLVFSMNQIGGTKQRTVIAASTSDMARDYVTFHNREGGRRSDLDNVSILSPPSNVPTFGTVLLRDRFDDNSLDGSLWNVVTAGIPQNPKSVTETNQRIQIQGRAHLNTAQEYDPAAGDGLTVRGRWTFQSGDDFMQILTRTDGAPGGGYGETNNGIEFLAAETSTTNNVTIRGRGGASVGGAVAASQWLLAGETYDFEIVDDGTNLALTMKQVGGPKAAVVTAASGSVMATNLISFHNREGGRVSHLDDVVIVDGTPGPLPRAWVQDFFHVRQVMSTGTVSNLADADALLAGTNAFSEASGLYRTINFLDTGGNGLIGNDARFPIDGAGDENDFAVEVLGQLNIDEAGDFFFGVNSDDGSRLRIDGIEVILDDMQRGPHSIWGHVELAAGAHDLEFVYFERAGGAEVELLMYDGAGNIALLQAIPEPATLTLLALGGLGFVARRRRKR